MRAVERTPWAERRNEAHDSLCLSIANNPRGWLLAAAEYSPKATPIVRVEHQCGAGFLDVLVETDDRSRAWLFEVKTDAERASAGDVIRQLRWYAANISGRYEDKQLVCVCENPPTETFSGLLLSAGVTLVVAGSRRAVTCDHCSKTSHQSDLFSAPKSDDLLLAEAAAGGWVFKPGPLCGECAAKWNETERELAAQ